MKKENIEIRQKINSSAMDAWEILKTGDDLDQWLPMIKSCELTGSGAGSKRICTTVDGKTMKETIVKVDEENRVFQYKIDEQDMLPTQNYVGTVQIQEDQNEVYIHWFAEYELLVPEAGPEVKKGLSELIRFCISSLDQATIKNV